MFPCGIAVTGTVCRTNHRWLESADRRGATTRALCANLSHQPPGTKWRVASFLCATATLVFGPAGTAKHCLQHRWGVTLEWPIKRRGREPKSANDRRTSRGFTHELPG